MAFRRGNRTIFAEGRLDINEGAIRILLSGPGGETSQEIQRRARAVQRRAQYRAPIRTGRLRSSIHVTTRYPSEGAVADIYSDAPYAVMVEFGRGVVKPRKGRWLVWEGDFTTVFTPKADAVGEVPFLRNALDAAGD